MTAITTSAILLHRISQIQSQLETQLQRVSDDNNEKSRKIAELQEQLAQMRQQKESEVVQRLRKESELATNEKETADAVKSNAEMARVIEDLNMREKALKQKISTMEKDIEQHHQNMAAVAEGRALSNAKMSGSGRL